MYDCHYLKLNIFEKKGGNKFKHKSFHRHRTDTYPEKTVSNIWNGGVPHISKPNYCFMHIWKRRRTFTFFLEKWHILPYMISLIGFCVSKKNESDHNVHLKNRHFIGSIVPVPWRFPERLTWRNDLQVPIRFYVVQCFAQNKENSISILYLHALSSPLKTNLHLSLSVS